VGTATQSYTAQPDYLMALGDCGPCGVLKSLSGPSQGKNCTEKVPVSRRSIFPALLPVLVDPAIFERYAGATKPTQLNEFERHTDFLGTKRPVGGLRDHFLR